MVKKIYIILGLLFFGSVLGLPHSEKLKVVPFEAVRHLDSVLDICSQNAYYGMREQLKKHLVSPPAHYRLPYLVVLESDKIPLGFIRYDATKVHFLVVAAHMQSRGHGSLLLRHAEDNMRDMGSNKVVLNVTVGNTDAERFYTKNGYHPTEGYKSHYDTCLEKDL